MDYLDLKKKTDVWVLTMTNGAHDNTFNDEVIKGYHTILDEIENTEENAALIITSDHPKTWNTGIDQAWFAELNAEDKKRYIKTTSLLFLRMALLNLPTVACITGNCYGAGAMMATAMDFRIMRADRGRFCFPEVDVKVPFDKIAIGLLRLIPNPQALKELVLTGVAWGGEQCLEKGVVDAVHPPELLTEKTIELARMLAQKDRQTYALLKRDLRYHLADLHSF